MAFDAHKNFAVSTVATAPSPATSGLSLIVAAGTGTLFPAVPFNATVWPATENPTTTNAEIVRVTAISTDTFTITRAQESSAARTIVAGDSIAANITNKTLTDIEASAQFVEQTSSATGQQDNFSLNGPKTVLYCTGTAPNFTGFTIAGATPKNGDTVIVYQASGTSAKVTHDASSTAANRAYTDSVNGQIVGLRGAVTLVYSETAGRWIQVAVQPGAWLDYTASSTITGWSSFQAGRKWIQFCQVGRTWQWQWHLEGTSNSAAITFTVPYAQQGSTYPYPSFAMGFAYDNGSTAAAPGNAQLLGGASTVTCYLNQTGAAWTASGTKIAAGALTQFTL